MGCGRLFECRVYEMWHSLKKIRSLPHNTKIFCGHEYSKKNAKFAQTLSPNNNFIRICAKNTPKIPSRLDIELKSNPFLRVDEIAFAKELNMSHLSPEKIFFEIRKRRNQF